MANDKKVQAPEPQVGWELGGITPPETAVATTPEAPKTMQVPVEKMDNLLSRMEALEEGSKKKDAEIAALNKTVSQTRLEEAKASVNVDKRPRVHFKKIHGKTVIGWPEKIGEDKKSEIIFSPLNPSSPAGELLKCKYTFIDGTKSELIDQVELTRSNEIVFARIIDDFGESVRLEFEDKSETTEELVVNKKFLNA